MATCLFQCSQLHCEQHLIYTVSRCTGVTLVSILCPSINLNNPFNSSCKKEKDRSASDNTCFVFDYNDTYSIKCKILVRPNKTVSRSPLVKKLHCSDWLTVCTGDVVSFELQPTSVVGILEWLLTMSFPIFRIFFTQIMFLPFLTRLG